MTTSFHVPSRETRAYIAKLFPRDSVETVHDDETRMTFVQDLDSGTGKIVWEFKKTPGLDARYLIEFSMRRYEHGADFSVLVMSELPEGALDLIQYHQVLLITPFEVEGVAQRLHLTLTGISTMSKMLTAQVNRGRNLLIYTLGKQFGERLRVIAEGLDELRKDIVQERPRHPSERLTEISRIQFSLVKAYREMRRAANGGFPKIEALERYGDSLPKLAQQPK